MGLYGSENFQTLLLLQTAAKRFQICPEFSSQRSLQNYIGDFEILSFQFLMVFFFIFVFTTVVYGKIKNLNYLKNEPP